MTEDYEIECWNDDAVIWLLNNSVEDYDELVFQFLIGTDSETIKNRARAWVSDYKIENQCWNEEMDRFDADH